jgi:hypothetical protein
MLDPLCIDYAPYSLKCSLRRVTSLTSLNLTTFSVTLKKPFVKF